MEGRKGRENQLVLSRLWAMQFHEASHPGIHLTTYHLSDPLSIHQSDHLSLHPSMREKEERKKKEILKKMEQNVSNR